MASQTNLFASYKECEYCKRPLPTHYEDDLCPACQETLLFHQVKIFIRENTVNEFEVAAHFNIPIKKVKDWIREGRIEYRETPNEATLTGVYCHQCGAPISFGTLCSKCLKHINGNKGFQKQTSDDNKMRYLDAHDTD